jgi:regulatory protein
MTKPRPLDESALWEYALRALARRAHSTAELREKLLRRAGRPGDVPAILARLKDYGYLDDRRFAEGFAAARLENEGFGKARALHDLRKRRVASTVAGKAVEKAYEGVEEQRLIEDFLQRKFRGRDLAAYLSEPKNLAAAYRRLRAAGFGGGESLRVLKRFAAEPELLDGLEDEDEGGEV